MIVNPAATGTKKYIPIQFNFRKQWVNFPGSPTTQSLSVHSSVAKNMGFGSVLFNDVAGPSRRTGINFNTSYQLRLDQERDNTLGFGLGVSLTQHTIDVNKLTTYLPEDPAVMRGFNNQIVPDANFGILYRYKDKAFAGISAHNLVELNRDLYDFDLVFINPLVRTYYFLGGYNFTLPQKWKLKSSTLFQLIETGTYQFDITAIAEFNNIFWFGSSYRHTDALVFMAGGKAGPFKFGYSYDYTTSDIGDYSYGSHEVFLELQIFKKSVESNSRVPWLKRNRIYSPEIR
jgi:type IX secretion system PorP/SprF family membrane protein